MKSQNNNLPSKVSRNSRYKLLAIIISCILVITLFACVYKPFRNELFRHRKALYAARAIENLGGRVSWNPKMEILETIMRDKALSRITDVHFYNPTFPDDDWLVLMELPQRFGLQVSGPGFTDKSLVYLREVKNMNYLVLTNTGVTRQGIADLQKTLPHIEVLSGGQ
jgi:hypothetical protein